MAVEVSQNVYDFVKAQRDNAQLGYDSYMQIARDNLDALHNWQTVLDDLTVKGAATPTNPGE